MDGLAGWEPRAAQRDGEMIEQQVTHPFARVVGQFVAAQGCAEMSEVACRLAGHRWSPPCMRSIICIYDEPPAPAAPGVQPVGCIWSMSSNSWRILKGL